MPKPTESQRKPKAKPQRKKPQSPLQTQPKPADPFQQTPPITPIERDGELDIPYFITQDTYSRLYFVYRELEPNCPECSLRLVPGYFTIEAARRRLTECRRYWQRIHPKPSETPTPNKEGENP